MGRIKESQFFYPPDTINFKILYNYDEKGNVIGEYNYDYKNSFLQKWISKYDKDKNLTEKARYSHPGFREKGILSDMSIFTYESDGMNNWTRCTRTYEEFYEEKNHITSSKGRLNTTGKPYF